MIPPAKKSDAIRSRIVAYKKVPASSLVVNPKNWRIHPQEQRDSLTTILKDVGYTTPILTRQLPGGRFEIIDGELRHDVMGNEMVDIVVTNLNDAEAKKILATHDPLASMANLDADKLNALVHEVSKVDQKLLDVVLAPSDFWTAAFEGDEEIWGDAGNPATPTFSTNGDEESEEGTSPQATPVVSGKLVGTTDKKKGTEYVTIEFTKEQVAAYDDALIQSKLTPAEFVFQAAKSYLSGQWKLANKKAKTNGKK